MLLCNTHIYNLPKKYSRYAALQILRCQTPVCDLTSGSGDRGTPVVLIQNYFTNYATE